MSFQNIWILHVTFYGHSDSYWLFSDQFDAEYKLGQVIDQYWKDIIGDDLPDNVLSKEDMDLNEKIQFFFDDNDQMSYFLEPRPLK